VVCLPFFLAAPTQMWRMVVLDQVGRDQGTDLLRRAAEIATMDRLTGDVASVAVVVVVAGSVACSVVTWRVRSFRVVVPVLLTTVLLLLAAPIFYPHYMGIVAVPAALLVGVTAGVLAKGSRRAAWRSALAVVALVAVTLDVVALSRIRSGDPVPAELAGPVRTAPGCLTSDDPNNLLALGVVGRNVERGCALVVDLGGHSHDLSRGQELPRSRNAAWQRLVVDYLGRGHYTLATRFGPGRGYSKVTVSTIESWPVRVRVESHDLREPSR
jgi:alpha-1,2-mannosyltransferase